MRWIKGIAAAAILCAAPSFAQIPGTFNPLVGSSVSGVQLDANATSSAYAGTATTVSNSNLTVGSGSNRALVAQLMFSTTTVTSVTCTWDVGGTNQSMTLIQSASNGVAERAELWGLVAPTSGNKTLTCSWTGSSNDAMLNATSFSGVNQTGGATTFPNATNATGTSTSPAVTVTSAAGDAAIDATAARQNYSAPLKSQLFIDNVHGSVIAAAASWASGAASVNFGWTIGASTTWVEVGTSIKAAP